MSAENRQELRRRIEMLVEDGQRKIDESVEDGNDLSEIHVSDIVYEVLEDEFIYDNDVINWWVEVPEYDSDNYYGEPDIIAQMRQVLVDYAEGEITPELEEYIKELMEAEDD